MPTQNEHSHRDKIGAELVEPEIDTIQQLAEISKNARTNFFGILAICAYAYLTIASTTDEDLILNSTISGLPIVQSNVSFMLFYYVTPLAFLAVFIYFHLYLQRFWRGVASLPARLRNRKSVDDYVYPWIISSAFLRAHVPALKKGRKLRHFVEWVICVIMAWCFIPVVLLFFWARFLTRQDWIGTSLHILTVALATATAISFYNTARDAVARVRASAAAPADRDESAADARNEQPVCPVTQRLNRAMLTLLAVALVSGGLLFISYGAIEGAPASYCEHYVRTEECSGWRRGVRVLRIFKGYSPFAEFQDRVVSRKPDDWRGFGQEGEQGLEKIGGANLKGRRLRFVQGRDAFLVKADLSGADLKWADLSQAALQAANLKNANLTLASMQESELQMARMGDANCEEADFIQANLEQSELTHTRFAGAILTAARLNQANGVNTDFTKADLRFAELVGVTFRVPLFVDASLNGANLNEAHLDNADFTRALLQNAHFRDAFLSRAVFTESILRKAELVAADLSSANFNRADLTHAKLNRSELYKAQFQQANLDRARLAGARAESADFTEAKMHFTDLTAADMRFANFKGAELNGASFREAILLEANFSNAQMPHAVFRDANLSGADFSGVEGLIPEQFAGACRDAHTVLSEELKIPYCYVEDDKK